MNPRPVRRVDAEDVEPDVRPVEEAEGIAVVSGERPDDDGFRVVDKEEVDDGRGDDSFDSGPTKNMLPPIGAPRPTAFWN